MATLGAKKFFTKLKKRKKSGLSSPKVDDPKFQRVIEKIYEDINKLKDATNTSKGTDSHEGEGNPGDIRVVKTEKKTYNLEVKGEEGWVTGKVGGAPIIWHPVGSRKKYEPSEITVNEEGETVVEEPPEVITADTITGFTSNFLTSQDLEADYESSWKRVEQSKLYYGSSSIERLIFNHDFNEFPYVIKVYYAPDYYNPSIGGLHGSTVSDINIEAFMQIDTGHVGSSSAGQMKYGTTHLITENQVIFLCGSASIINIPTNMLEGTASWDVSASGAFKILAWKRP